MHSPQSCLSPIKFILPILLMTGWMLPTGSLAEDWPQWMGPSRDNVWQADNVVQSFPDAGLPVKWSCEVANGYAGPAVVGNRVYVTDFSTAGDVKISNFDRRAFEGTERILCIDAESGRQIWSHEYPVTYAISYPAGPRCTPLVEGNRVTTLGAEGHLVCLNTDDGSVIWKRDLKTEYNTKSALWGYAGHPMIDGDKLIMVVGGEGSHTVAFDKKTGEELWRYGTASEQGYCPVKIIEAAGVRQLITTSPDWVASLDPETGKQLWQTPYEATNGSVIMTPIHYGDYLFVGGYSKRNLMLKLNSESPGVEVLFRDKAKLGISPVNVQPFLQDDLIIGMDGDGAMLATEIPSGERLWETGQPIAERPVGVGTAFVVKHDDRFFLFAESGELVIAEMGRDGYSEIDRTKVIEPTNNAFGRPVVWTAPAFANGCIFVRNDQKMVCVDLTARDQ